MPEPSKMFFAFILLFTLGCVSVPQEEVYDYGPSFWGEEEEESPLYRPEKVKQEKKTWFSISSE